MKLFLSMGALFAISFGKKKVHEEEPKFLKDSKFLKNENT